VGAHYLDTSSFVKLYVREPGTDKMVRLANPSGGHSLYVLGLTRVECRSAVRLRERKGDLAHDVADTLISRMEQHLRTLYLIQLVTDAVLEQAVALLDRHPLKAYDAVQLAGCLVLQSQLGEPVTFVCSDDQLLLAAEGEGVLVMNPAAEPAT
jgi:predicted nucleic acid-binding protein